MPENRPARFFYGYIVMAAAFLIMLLMWGAYYTYGIFFTPLLDEFGWTRAETSGAFSLSFILSGLLGIGAGRLNDRFGPRMVMTACGLVLGLGFVLMSRVQTLWHLYLYFGLVIGSGMAGSFPPIVSTIARWFVKRCGMMTGLTISSVGVGTLVMPPLANWLISRYGWRDAFAAMGLIVMALIVLIAQWLRKDPRQVGQLPYGENELAAGAALMLKGVTLSEVLRRPPFWMLAVVMLSYGLATGTVQVHVVPHAIRLGFAAASASVVLSVTGALGAAGRILIGTASDRIGNRTAEILSISLVTVSFFLALIAKELWQLYLFAALFGFGIGGMASLISPIVAGLFGLKAHGAIVGVVMLAATTGSAVGPVIAGYIFDVSQTYFAAFLICAIMSVIGLGMVMFLRKNPAH